MARTVRVDGKEVTKKSGATFSKYVPKKGPNKSNNQYITNAWCIIKKDLVNFSCVTTKKSEVKSSGWFGHIACTMVNKVTGEEQFFWGTMQKSTGKVIIEKLSYVINPKAPNGGYCGTFIR